MGFGKEYLMSKRMQSPRRDDLLGQPIVVVLQNGQSTQYANVPLYNSYTNRTAPNQGLPMTPPPLSVPAIVATSATPNLTYLEILVNSEAKPFKVGRIMIISSSTGQIETPFVINHGTDNSGNMQHTVTPIIDPFAKQIDRLYVDYEFELDGFSGVAFNTFNALATVQVELYLVKRFSGTLAAAGKKPVIYYGR